jgi:integrase
LVATGLRRSELLGLRWADVDLDAGLLHVTGKVTRVAGRGLVRLDETKSKAGRRTIKLAEWAVEVLHQRRLQPYIGSHEAVFASTTGGWRDPNNFGRTWREVRERLGVANVTVHSFRKSLASLIDGQGFSPRVGADVLRHARPSMTQDHYMRRGQQHAQVADMLDRVINGE